MSYQDPYNPYSNTIEYDPYSHQQRQYSATQGSVPSFGSNHGQRQGSFSNSDQPSQPATGQSQRSEQPQRQATMRSFVTGNTEATRPNFNSSVPAVPGQHTKQDSMGFDADYQAGDKEAVSSFSQYRAAHNEGIWTKGGSGRCVGRFCCCSIMTVVFLLVSIVGALALYIRPPAISIGSVGAPTDGTPEIQPTSDGITVNLGVNIFVSNPNYFSVNFKYVKAEIFYPINNTAIGGGEINNLMFDSNSARNFTFPFAIEYETSKDPRSLILRDLANKCGLGGTKSDIVVDYKITLGIRFAIITISPSISNSFTFACPIDPSDISSLMSGVGISTLFSSRQLQERSADEL